jgi:hypothetical protein
MITGNMATRPTASTIMPISNKTTQSTTDLTP